MHASAEGLHGRRRGARAGHAARVSSRMSMIVVEREYRPFPDVGRRNIMQELLEVPLLVRALGLPPGGRILEIGCGRGIALPPLSRLLAPRRLVGIDIDTALLAVARARAAAAGIAAALQRA